MVEVTGSLWSVSPHERHVAALRAKEAGLTTLHWDMTDGEFAPPGGFRSDYAAVFSADLGMRSEAHLMTHSPLQEVDAWSEFCDRVIIHMECEDWIPAVQRIEARGSRAAVAVNMTTPLDQVPRGLDVLCMSITPGSAGSRLDPHVFRRIETLRAAPTARGVGVDGGVRAHHIVEAERVGASWVAVGTDLFGSGGTARWSSTLARTR